MQEAVDRYRSLVDAIPARLVAIPEAECESRPGAGKWSKKEILGHLIDSAANNHQRFIRAQAEPQSSFPGYAQEFWGSTQQYQLESWEAMIELWKSYNIHLLHVVA